MSDAPVLIVTAPGPQGAEGPPGPQGIPGTEGGPAGPPGVVAATAPLTYDALAQAVGITIGHGLEVQAGKLALAPFEADYADLAALPDAATSRGLLARTDDGATYWSDGAVWTVIVPPAGTYQPAGQYQATNANLTALAALNATAYGRGFLPLASAAAARTYIGAGSRVMGYVTGNRQFPTAALADVVGLANMAVEVNLIYRLAVTVFCNSPAAAGLRIGWIVPEGAVLTWEPSNGLEYTQLDTPVIPTTGANQSFRMTGRLDMGGTAGLLKMQAAQGVANGVAAAVRTGTFAELWSP